MGSSRGAFDPLGESHLECLSTTLRRKLSLLCRKRAKCLFVALCLSLLSSLWCSRPNPAYIRSLYALGLIWPWQALGLSLAVHHSTSSPPRSVMSTSEKDDASLPRSEMMNQVSEISPLGSKWTARDIEELPSATKLCTSCLRLVDFLERYFLKFCTTKTKGEAWSFTQHASHKSLKRSKTLGCHICPIIYADWIDKDSTLLEGYDKFGSRLQSATYEPFAEFSLETYAENPQGRIRSGTWILKVTECEIFAFPCSRDGPRLMTRSHPNKRFLTPVLSDRRST